MSTTITTRLERRIEANPRGLTIIETIRGDMIQAALTPDEARQIAAALTADQGGQWTRDDLPHAQWLCDTFYDKSDSAMEAMERIACDLVAHLNAHHPKPGRDFSGVAWKGQCEAAERKCVELRSLIEGQKANVTQAQRERDDADQRCAEAEADRDRWKLHHDRVDGQWAKAEREVTRLRGTGAVSEADIEKAVRSVAVNPIWEAAAREIIDAVWALHEGTDRAVYVVRESDLPEVERDEDGNWIRGDVLVYGRSAELEMVRQHVASALETVADCEAVARAIEAEQSVDPVEEKADELYGAYHGQYPAVPWPSLNSVGREKFTRLAAHVLGQGADQ